MFSNCQMKYSLFSSIFAFCLINAWTYGYTVPDATVDILKPKGFRLSIPHEDGISEVSYNVKINQRINLYQPGDFAAIIKERTSNLWAFDNINTHVQPGDAINYWVHVQFENGKNLREVGTAVVTSDTLVISNFCSDILQTGNQECPATDKVECELSVTTVGGKRMCKGQLIFEDNFDKLDWNKWTREVRMPLSADDGQFVVFLDRRENCNVKNGQLHIVPSLSSDIFGTNVTRIRTGEFNLGSQCTAIIDKTQECRKKAQFFQILPPVISARINTKNSFSFRYGKVEIRAKLPKGDWLFPLILLEPLEHFYGLKDYASGQIRIAFNRGNDYLQDSNYTDISNKWLSGGAILTNLAKYRDYFLRGLNRQLDLSSEFHTYSLTWTDTHFLLETDEYSNSFDGDFTKWQEVFHGSRRSNSKMAPFDREFYLALGVAAGGHSDFPDNSVNGPERKPKPWRNGDPKAELYFWKDTVNWFQTWRGDNSGLHVDYVKVYAL